jgi:hypothetical protein
VRNNLWESRLRRKSFVISVQTFAILVSDAQSLRHCRGELRCCPHLPRSTLVLRLLIPQKPANEQGVLVLRLRIPDCADRGMQRTISYRDPSSAIRRTPQHKHRQPLVAPPRMRGRARTAGNSLRLDGVPPLQSHECDPARHALACVSGPKRA